MPLYVSFSRAQTTKTILWYEPMEEEGVGRGAIHEVVSDSYRHITRSSQRRLSIARLSEKEGEFFATHVKGATGRTRSEKPSALTSKIMHEHLATDARLSLWSGNENGQVTCACGKVLSWNGRGEVGCLQWHMLACTLTPERVVRRYWYRAIKNALLEATADSITMETVIRCWGVTKQGDIIGAITDEAYDWRPPAITVTHSGWRYAPEGNRPPTFPTDDDDTDSASNDSDDSSDDDSNHQFVTTATGDEGYRRDWDGIDSAALPQMAAAKLLLRARRMVDSSRWWTLRWPQNSVSLLSRACSLDTGKTYKLFKKLRKITIHYVTELWQAVLNRRHEADDRTTRVALRVDWVRLNKLLGRGTNRRGTSMPGWNMVKKKPAHTICLQLVKWKKWRDSIMRTGGQRRITSYFNRVKELGGEAMSTTEVHTTATTTGEPTATETDGDGCLTSRTPSLSLTPATHHQTTVGDSIVGPEMPEADITATLSVDADGATACPTQTVKAQGNAGKIASARSTASAGTKRPVEHDSPDGARPTRRAVSGNAVLMSPLGKGVKRKSSSSTLGSRTRRRGSPPASPATTLPTAGNHSLSSPPPHARLPNPPNPPLPPPPPEPPPNPFGEPESAPPPSAGNPHS